MGSGESSPRVDILAGIALAGLLVPEAMTYAGIAGVLAQMGLYAATAGLFVCALLREGVPGKPAAFSKVADTIEGKVTLKTEYSAVLSRYRCRRTCMTGSDSLLTESEIAKVRASVLGGTLGVS